MANDLSILQQDAVTVIDPAGAPGSILAQNHQNLFLSAINNLGKYTGLQFKSVKETDNGIVNNGYLIWNGNSMNNTNPFTLTLSTRTLDNQLVKRVLERLKNGDLIKFKDYKGKACFLEFKKYWEDVDGNNTPIWNLTVIGFAENPIYTYQPTEINDCMLEVFASSVESGLQYVQNVIQQTKLEFNWAMRDDEDEASNTRWYQSTRIDGKVALLGLKINNYDSLLSQFQGANFTLLIDRYIKQGWKGFQNNSNYAYKTHQKAGYFHSRQDTLAGKINEIPITAQEMLLNFNQDFYFRPKGVSFAQQSNFPYGMGRTQKGVHITSNTALGYIDLGFRIRVEIPTESYVWESQQLGKIRMIGVDDRHEPAVPAGFRYITYSYK